MSGVSPAADLLIVNEETGGQQFYEAREIHPDWPGGASGVTIGCGYDCGYSTSEDIAADWGPLLSATVVSALQSTVGVRGSPASALAHELKWITVPWDAAMAVFHNRDLPKWVNICARALPNFDMLNGDCKGALVSLAFNRGASFDLTGPRYAEMRNIKSHMQGQAFDLIPAEILAMRRLWPQGGDLWNRRGHEAALFKQGLTQGSP